MFCMMRLDGLLRFQWGRYLVRAFGLLWPLVVAPSYADSGSLLLADLRQAEIALVNITTGPGLQSVIQETDSSGRSSLYDRSSLGGSSDLTFKNRIYDIFGGAALIRGRLSDNYDIQLDPSSRYDIAVNRDVLALRASAGLTLPYNRFLKLRPYLSFIVSDLNTESSIYQLPESVQRALSDRQHYFNFSSSAWSVVSTLELDYYRWFGRNRLEVLGVINYSHTDTLSTDSPELDSAAWGATAMVKTKFSRDLKWKMYQKPFVAHLFYNYTDYMDQPKVALGFTQLQEVGVGLDWEWQIKPLDWVGFTALGLKGAYVFGDGVKGYSFGVMIR